jgi:cation:H+ antiporter
MLADVATPMVVAGFAVSAAVVGWAGSRLSRLAAFITDRTRLGPALVGALFLGGATSLPEIATTFTAVAVGDVPLALGNLLGGVALQMALLALADAWTPGALSAQAQRGPLLGQSGSLALLLVLALCGLLLPAPDLLGMGAFSFAILGVAPIMFLLLRRRRRKAPAPATRAPMAAPGDGQVHAAATVGRAAILASAILAAGVLLVLSAEELAGRFSLQSSFVGASGVALATSLPEIATTVTAARMGRATLAVSNILGTNILEATLLAAVDLLAPGTRILAQAGSVAVGLAALGLVLVAVYAGGALWRRQPVVMRLGVDSWLAVTLYLGGMAWLATW